MKKIYIILCLLLFSVVKSTAQKINTDSLLVETNKLINIEKKYPEAIQLGLKGIKAAPNYLDFHIALGRSYNFINKKDSAAYYFNYVIEKNPKYKEAFGYLTQIEIENKNTVRAHSIVDHALSLYPDDKSMQLLKLNVLEAENDSNKSIDYLKELIQKYPEDQALKGRLLDTKLNSKSDRIGVSYNITNFNRSGIGPWDFTSVQFIRQRKRLTLIARYNYTDRKNNGSVTSSGSLFEGEAYVKTTNKTYSFLNIGFGNDNVFPKIRVNYSAYFNLGKGWENEIGFRYNKTINNESYSGVIGFGKYLGSGWLNLRSYLQLKTANKYPSFSAQYRYYTNTRYDYLSASIGYGTSPDERETLSQYEQRIALHSYRIGLGYSKLIQKKYTIGITTNFNRQEYNSNQYQSELNTAVQLQYIF
jgi:YaiO family outer membrane protein